MHSSIRTLAALSFALAFAGIAQAQTQRIEISADRDTATAAQVASQVAAQIGRDGARQFRMETGRQLHVAGRGSALRVRYGGKPAAVVRHDGAGRFVSADGALELRFALDARGQPDIVHLTMPSTWL
jgi:hypothetical protein